MIYSDRINKKQPFLRFPRLTAIFSRLDEVTVDLDKHSNSLEADLITYSGIRRIIEVTLHISCYIFDNTSSVYLYILNGNQL